MEAEIQEVCNSIDSLSFLYADEFEANIKQDFNAYPVLVMQVQSIQPKNLDAVSDFGGSDIDVFSLKIAVYCKGGNDLRGLQHLTLQEQAYEYFKVFMYKLSKYSDFAGYTSFSSNFVKNKFDSFADGIEVNLKIEWKNLTDYQCYFPTEG